MKKFHKLSITSITAFPEKIYGQYTNIARIFLILLLYSAYSMDFPQTLLKGGYDLRLFGILPIWVS